MVEVVFAIGKTPQIPGVLAQAIWALLMQDYSRTGKSEVLEVI